VDVGFTQSDPGQARSRPAQGPAGLPEPESLLEAAPDSWSRAVRTDKENDPR